MQEHNSRVREKPRIMLVESEPAAARLVLATLTSAGYECQTFVETGSALATLQESRPDVIVAEYKSDHDATDLINAVRLHSPETAVILLVANPVAAAGVAAIRQGAFDYLTQPVNPDELAAVVAKALEMAALRHENRMLHEQLEVASMAAAFVAESVASRNLAAIVRRAAPANSPVLIEGESGTGKELIARMLHHWSSRANGPFVKVSFKSLSPGDLASGWADSMQRPRAGAAAMLAEYFDRAAGGTIFLDEISEAAAEFQSALLRLIGDENHLRKNAATRTARVVASTNRTFVSELASGRIRPDLYFALNVISIQVAPLRERPEDILPLARHFLASQVAETGRSMVLTPEAEKALLSHSWPGNVRELENMIERAVVMSSSERIAPEALMLGARIPDVLPPPASPEIEVRTRPAREESPKKQSALAHATTSETQAAAASTVAQEEASRESPLPMEGTLQEVLDHAATSRVSKAIDSARGDRNAAAAALGIDRATLDRLMRRLHL